MIEGPAALPEFADAGVAGTYPPSPEEGVARGAGLRQEFQRLTNATVPLACWRMDELWFEFDSSFPRPEAATELPLLHALRMRHGAAPMSVFGQTDVRDLRRPASAAAYCRIAAERTGRKDPDAFEGLARALDQLGDAAGAVAYAKKAVALLPPSGTRKPASQQRITMETALKRYRANRR